jgi:hypothetical protein
MQDDESETVSIEQVIPVKQVHQLWNVEYTLKGLKLDDRRTFEPTKLDLGV